MITFGFSKRVPYFIKGQMVEYFFMNLFLIGRRDIINWSARCPDLTLFDFLMDFLWGYLKDYKTKPQNLVELQQQIIDETMNIYLENTY